MKPTAAAAAAEGADRIAAGTGELIVALYMLNAACAISRASYGTVAASVMRAVRRIAYLAAARGPV